MTTAVMNNIESDYAFKSNTELSEIQSFYNGATVFLTGATGFMGNLILEKLIRTCSGVKKIYILIREKKGKTTEERFKDLFNDSIFELMKQEQPNYLEKISAVIGDCALPNLGINEQYQQIIKDEVNIVIHSAATVRFDEHLRLAVSINIIALQDMLKLSRQIKNLKSFVHISTAYSNCAGRKVLDEIFYKPPITGEKLSQLVKSLDDEYITNITPALLKDWPNTYAMTKAIAENEVLTHGKGLPVGIIRPSMIIATDHEPIPGWINNFYGPTGVVAATGIGLMRCMRADSKEIADIIPGDYVSNAVLACAWDIHNKWRDHKQSDDTVEAESVVETDISDNRTYLPPIYNFVSSSVNPLSWGQFSSLNKKYGQEVPTVKAIWPVMLRLSRSKYEYLILCFLLHTLPGLIIDSIAKIVGKEPKLMDGYRKLHKFAEVISYFSLQSWTFHDENTRSLVSKLSNQDKSLFHFDVSKLDWNEYFKKHVVGIRMYIVKDPMVTLPQGIQHSKKLNMALYSLLAILVAMLFMVFYGVASLL